MWRKHLDDYYDLDCYDDDDEDRDGDDEEQSGGQSGERPGAQHRDSSHAELPSKPQRGGARGARGTSNLTPNCKAKTTTRNMPGEVSEGRPVSTREASTVVQQPPSKRTPASKSRNTTSPQQPPCLSLAVAGHVDTGKSTLTGHLLYKMGATTASETSSVKRSLEGRKEKYFFAWLLDGGVDERQRGVTIDVTVKTLSTPSRRFCMLDTPGHTEFVPNMILGTAQADAAILVVDPKGFDAGFCKGGETKQHLRLISALGIPQMIVAINKMDLIDWDEAEFRILVARIDEYITTSGEVSFEPGDVTYVPVAALPGFNITPVEKGEHTDLPAWVKEGPSLLEAMDSLSVAKSSAAHVGGTLCLCVAEAFEWKNVPVLAGKVVSGTIHEGDQVLVMPGDLTATVKDLHLTDYERVPKFEAGEYATIVQLDKVNATQLHRGSVIVSLENLAKVVVCSEFYAHVSFFHLVDVIIPGSPVVVHLGTAVEAGFVKAIVYRSNRTLSIFSGTSKDQPTDVARRPKLLRSNESGLVLLTVDRPICVQYFDSSAPAAQISPLCRAILRYENRTIGAGVVVTPESSISIQA